MNTIPLTFNGWEIPYSVIGGTAVSSAGKLPVTIVLLNRGGKYFRSSVFHSLTEAGFSSIMSVENNTEPYDIEVLSPRFPSVKFLIPQKKLSIGEMINAGVAEASSDFVFILWNDQRINSTTNIEKIIGDVSKNSLFCAAPVLSGHKFDSLPVQMMPSLNKKQFQIQPLPCLKDLEPTIYPFDFTGIYNRAKFIEFGGFDSSIQNPFWQNADFGFRTHLWGEEIRIFHHLKIFYETEIPAENVIADVSYLRFYLKNLAPVLKSHGAILPLQRFFTFACKSRMNIFDSWLYFRSASQWISINGMKFKKDAASLVESWEPVVS